MPRSSPLFHSQVRSWQGGVTLLFPSLRFQCACLPHSPPQLLGICALEKTTKCSVKKKRKKSENKNNSSSCLVLFSYCSFVLSFHDSHNQRIMHSSLITCCLILIIVLFSSQSSFSSRLKDEVNSIKITNEPSKVIKYKYPHHYHHNNRKFHPKHLDHLRLFKQQVLDAPSDSVDRSRRSQLHTVRVVSTDVSFSIDSNGSSVLKGSRNRSRSHVLGREDPSSLAEAAATDNLNNVLSYRCHHPKPRIVYLDQTTLGKQYWPR